MRLAALRFPTKKRRNIMPDKKMNVLDRILCAFRPKKELCADIIAQADSVIENYIYNKNRLIHRKCSRARRGERTLTLMIFASSAALAAILFKIFI